MFIHFHYVAILALPQTRMINFKIYEEDFTEIITMLQFKFNSSGNKKIFSTIDRIHFNYIIKYIVTILTPPYGLKPLPRSHDFNNFRRGFYGHTCTNHAFRFFSLTFHKQDNVLISVSTAFEARKGISSSSDSSKRGRICTCLQQFTIVHNFHCPTLFTMRRVSRGLMHTN